MFLNFLNKYRDAGLLILRLGLGSMFILHGFPKLFDRGRWEGIGKAMSNLGIRQGYEFWGFMAGFTEFFGGICLILGFCYRPACLLLSFTMAVAALKLYKQGESFSKFSHPLEVGMVFLSSLLIGPGKFSLDEKGFGTRKARKTPE